MLIPVEAPMHTRATPYHPPPAISWDVEIRGERWTLQTPSRMARPVVLAWWRAVAALRDVQTLDAMDVVYLASGDVVRAAWAHPELDFDSEPSTYEQLHALGWSDAEIEAVADAVAGEWGLAAQVTVEAVERARFFGPRMARSASSTSPSGSATSGTSSGGTAYPTPGESS